MGSENQNDDIYDDTINVLEDAGGEVGDLGDEYVGVVGGDCYFLGDAVEDGTFEHLPVYGYLEEVKNRGVHVYVLIITG